MKLEGRVGVVTGATKGIGRGVARELAQHGARVYVTGRSAPEHEHVDQRTTLMRCDHTVDTQVDAVFARVLKECDGVDVLVNAVWGGYDRMMEDGTFTWANPFWEQPLWRWDAMFAAGVRAHYRASQLVAKNMVARKSGLIVNISHWAARNTSATSRTECQKLPPTN
jgi:NAD(P)-dependent dehydrogenase (short-subunit alcohol dehydrogenase family)